MKSLGLILPQLGFFLDFYFENLDFQQHNFIATFFKTFNIIEIFDLSSNSNSLFEILSIKFF